MNITTAITFAPYDLRRLPAPRIHKRVTIAEIQARVAQQFNVRIAELQTSSRKRRIARPRQVAMYLAHRHTTASLPEIGRRLGNRDHTTVIHGIRQIERLRNIDADLDAEIEAIQFRLGGA